MPYMCRIPCSISKNGKGRNVLKRPDPYQVVGGGVRRFLELQAITVYPHPFYAISYAIRHSLRRNYISAISRSWTF